MHPNQREHTVIGPNGNEITFTHIAGFASQNDMSHNSLSQLINGRLKSCKGFRLKGDPKKVEPRTHKMISPNGEVLMISNITQLHKETGIPLHWLKKVTYGEREDACGWRMFKGEGEGVEFISKDTIKDDKQVIINDCFKKFMNA